MGKDKTGTKKFYVRYVEGCTSKLKSFTSKKEATKFVANFFLKYQFGNTDDNWIDCIFEGNIIYTEPAVPVNDTYNYSGR